MPGCGCKECDEKENFGDNGACASSSFNFLEFMGACALLAIIIFLFIWMWRQLRKQGPILTFLDKKSAFGKKRLR